MMQKGIDTSADVSDDMQPDVQLVFQICLAYSNMPMDSDDCHNVVASCAFGQWCLNKWLDENGVGDNPFDPRISNVKYLSSLTETMIDVNVVTVPYPTSLH
jgi:hypothetical protein